MTTIVWDGTALAADRLVTSSCGAMALTKIRRTSDGRLIGGAGDTVFVSRWLDWLAAPAAARGGMPAFQSDKDDYVAGIEILADGAVRLHERHGWFAIESRVTTIGSGAAFARGAMAAGATARRAVEIAAEFDGGTGGGVDVLTLAEICPDRLALARQWQASQAAQAAMNGLDGLGGYHGVGKHSL